MQNCKLFFDTYGGQFRQDSSTKIVEIGSQDVNGSLRTLAPAGVNYIGVDFQSAKGVDIVLEDPYSLPFEADSVDIVLCSSCYEHSEMFWLSFLEVIRILKPEGLFYLNVPSNGPFHRHPVDCWRFYPDSGQALISWARRNNYDSILLESYISNQEDQLFNDFVGDFLKDQKHTGLYKHRILEHFQNFKNGRVLGEDGFRNHAALPEDQLKLRVIKQIINGKPKIN